MNTVETSVEAVTKELQSTLSGDRLRESLEDYVAKLQLPKSYLKAIPNQALNLLGEPNLPPGSSTDLFNMLKSANPEDLASGKVRQRLTQMLGLGNSQGDGQNENKRGVGLRERSLQIGTDALMAMLLARQQDSSQEKTEPIPSQIESARERLGDFLTKLADYLRNTNREELNPELLEGVWGRPQVRFDSVESKQFSSNYATLTHAPLKLLEALYRILLRNLG